MDSQLLPEQDHTILVTQFRTQSFTSLSPKVSNKNRKGNAICTILPLNERHILRFFFYIVFHNYIKYEQKICRNICRPFAFSCILLTVLFLLNESSKSTLTCGWGPSTEAWAMSQNWSSPTASPHTVASSVPGMVPDLRNSQRAETALEPPNMPCPATIPPSVQTAPSFSDLQITLIQWFIQIHAGFQLTEMCS